MELMIIRPIGKWQSWQKVRNSMEPYMFLITILFMSIWSRLLSINSTLKDIAEELKKMNGGRNDGR